MIRLTAIHKLFPWKMTYYNVASKSSKSQNSPPDVQRHIISKSHKNIYKSANRAVFIISSKKNRPLRVYPRYYFYNISFSTMPNLSQLKKILCNQNTIFYIFIQAKISCEVKSLFKEPELARCLPHQI